MQEADIVLKIRQFRSAVKVETKTPGRKKISHQTEQLRTSEVSTMSVKIIPHIPPGFAEKGQ